MKKIILFLILGITLVFTGIGSAFETDKSNTAGVREPVMAGRFYPGDTRRLSEALKVYFKAAEPPVGGRPIAIISPHAGYVYSGQISADAFNQAAGYEYDLVVLLGTNHTMAGFSGVSLFSKGGYRTPLGTAKIDEKTTRELFTEDKEIIFKEPLHRNEHSIEVQVPFVQWLFPKAKIVPAIVATSDTGVCSRFGKALAKVLKGRRALIVASSDFSHYPGYEDAVRVDRTTLDAILTMDLARVKSTLQHQIGQNVHNLSTCVCGEGAILTALVAAKALGATCGRLVSYANSGDALIGDRSRVVGYGAVSFFAGSNCTSETADRSFPSEMTNKCVSPDQKEALVCFARETIRQILEVGTIPLARGFDPVLEKHRGAFVTLKKHGKLRGCMGHMAEDLPLCQAVGTMAIQAAFNDPRFPTVTLNELPDIKIEISVLTPFQPVNQPEDIIVGRDGVLLRKSDRSAVFLPQVALEQGWNRDQMLDHLCKKAGLPTGSWKNGAQLFTFQAEVFSELHVKD
ncbi:MAG: AmmeMemoRadiSam system protein B [Thermodesulfobacteriota bacterium]|nr:AmmeMemoRadiSam system protein B [Thermodesulfobacteriota bacterium]